MQLPDNPNQEQQSDGVGACPTAGQTFFIIFVFCENLISSLVLNPII